MRPLTGKLLLAVALSLLMMSAVAQSDFESFNQQRRAGFEEYKRSLEEQFAAFKAIHAEETEKFTKSVKNTWAEPELSTQTAWVEYSPDLSERTTVDFEADTIIVESTGDSNDAASPDALRQILTELVSKNQAQAFADDAVAQAVETRSVAEIEDIRTAEVEPTPILIPYLTGLADTGAAMVAEIVDYMLERAKTTTEPGKDGMTVRRVEVPLASPATMPKTANASAIPDGMPAKARSYWNYVDNFASVAKMERALVYAVMETESSFNPMAKSPIPAYGLMQIVPESAGKDATAQLHGKQKVLAPSYLYNPGNNIEIGATYLNILYYRYLKDIKDPESRLYCSIAAYNTGAGNVAKAFTGRMRIQPAVAKINALSAEQVYSTLIKNLPYSETRRYLKKVSQRMEKYSAMGI